MTTNDRSERIKAIAARPAPDLYHSRFSMSPESDSIRTLTPSPPSSPCQSLGRSISPVGRKLDRNFVRNRIQASLFPCLTGKLKNPTVPDQGEKRVPTNMMAHPVRNTSPNLKKTEEGVLQYTVCESKSTRERSPPASPPRLSSSRKKQPSSRSSLGSSRARIPSTSSLSEGELSRTTLSRSPSPQTSRSRSRSPRRKSKKRKSGEKSSRRSSKSSRRSSKSSRRSSKSSRRRSRSPRRRSRSPRRRSRSPRRRSRSPKRRSRSPRDRSRSPSHKCRKLRRSWSPVDFWKRIEERQVPPPDNSKGKERVKRTKRRSCKTTFIEINFPGFYLLTTKQKEKLRVVESEMEEKRRGTSVVGLISKEQKNTLLDMAKRMELDNAQENIIAMANSVDQPVLKGPKRSYIELAFQGFRSLNGTQQEKLRTVESKMEWNNSLGGIVQLTSNQEKTLLALAAKMELTNSNVKAVYESASTFQRIPVHLTTGPSSSSVEQSDQSSIERVQRIPVNLVATPTTKPLLVPLTSQTVVPTIQSVQVSNVPESAIPDRQVPSADVAAKQLTPAEGSVQLTLPGPSLTFSTMNQPLTFSTMNKPSNYSMTRVGYPYNIVPHFRFAAHNFPSASPLAFPTIITPVAKLQHTTLTRHALPSPRIPFTTGKPPTSPVPAERGPDQPSTVGVQRVPVNLMAAPTTKASLVPPTSQTVVPTTQSVPVSNAPESVIPYLQVPSADLPAGQITPVQGSVQPTAPGPSTINLSSISAMMNQPAISSKMNPPPKNRKVASKQPKKVNPLGLIPLPLYKRFRLLTEQQKEKLPCSVEGIREEKGYICGGKRKWRKWIIERSILGVGPVGQNPLTLGEVTTESKLSYLEKAEVHPVGYLIKRLEGKEDGIGKCNKEHYDEYAVSKVVKLMDDFAAHSKVK
eukprot:sb/3479785/